MKQSPNGNILFGRNAEYFPERGGKIRTGHPEQGAEFGNLNVAVQLKINVIHHFHKVGNRKRIRQMPGTRVFHLNGDLTPAELKERGYAGMDYRNTILKANEHWVAEAHALGLEVNVWTVNTREEMEYFLNLGVDYITTDEPELLQALIRERSGK